MNWIEVENRLALSLKEIYADGEATAISSLVTEHLSGYKKVERFLKEKNNPSEDQLLKLKEIQTRLQEEEPVQYVLNEAWFGSLKFYVDARVLIPRPETEELVEWVIKDCRFPVTSLHILDVGCGSGCIPVSLKRRIRKADVWACDNSDAALKVAALNAEALGAAVSFLQLDFLNTSCWHTLPSFDIITSNPPYIPESDKTNMHNNVLAYEPHTALFVPDNDPLLFYKALAMFGKTYLKPEGSIFMEIHESLGKEVVSVFEAAGFNTVLRQDMQGKDRMVKAFNITPLLTSTPKASS